MEETFYTCPKCWEQVSILVDVSLDAQLRFVEDCEVCCNPLSFIVRVRRGTVDSLEVDTAQ